MFALRHKATGTFMPDKKGGAGGTYVEPFQRRRRQTTTPRLFAREQDAKSALAWWADGRVLTRYDAEWGREIVGVAAVAGRDAAEWEIVSVELKVVS